MTLNGIWWFLQQVYLNRKIDLTAVAFFCMICMYCHSISNDLTLDFDQTTIAPFRKRIALQIISGTEYTSLDELSYSSTSEVIVLNDGKDKVSNTIP
jgi:hypothetical protein